MNSIAIFLGVVALFKNVYTKPLIDKGVLVIQGVTSCRNGTGYCLLGEVCEVDKDFLKDETGGHCDGLLNAFTPKVNFVCCKYNPDAKLTSELPTTTISSYTITGKFEILDEHADLNKEEDEIPENLDPSSIIDIVGVYTDHTAVLGLITQPWTGTIPTRPTTTPMPSPLTTIATTAALISPATTEIIEPRISLDDAEPTTFMTETAETTDETDSYHEMPTTEYVNDEETSPDTSEKRISSWSDLNDGYFKLPSPLVRPNDGSSLILLTDEGQYIEVGPKIESKFRNEAIELNYSPTNSISDIDTGDTKFKFPNYMDCGIKGKSFGINYKNYNSGVSSANSNEWCWVTSIIERRSNNYKYLCTGTLIRPDVVLTTAICTKNIEYSIESYKVQVGGSNILGATSFANPTQILDIDEISTHPMFDFSGGASVYDIGIIKLRKSAIIQNNVCTICLDQNPGNTTKSEGKCSAVGFNFNTPNNFRRQSIEVLMRQINVDIQSKSSCKKDLFMSSYSPIALKSNSLLCVKENQFRTNSEECSPTVDRGSPLGCELDGRWFLKGLKSWKERCKTHFPKDVYTDVGYFVPWISDIITMWDLKTTILKR